MLKVRNQKSEVRESIEVAWLLDLPKPSLFVSSHLIHIGHQGMPCMFSHPCDSVSLSYLLQYSLAPSCMRAFLNVSNRLLLLLMMYISSSPIRPYVSPSKPPDMPTSFSSLNVKTVSPQRISIFIIALRYVLSPFLSSNSRANGTTQAGRLGLWRCFDHFSSEIVISAISNAPCMFIPNSKRAPWNSSRPRDCTLTKTHQCVSRSPWLHSAGGGSSGQLRSVLEAAAPWPHRQPAWLVRECE